MSPQLSPDQFGVRALVRYKAVLVEIDETIRRTKQTIEKSHELIKQLDRVIDVDSRQKGYPLAAEPQPEIIVVIPSDWTQFARLVIGSLIAENVRPATAARSLSRTRIDYRCGLAAARNEQRRRNQYGAARGNPRYLGSSNKDAGIRA